jgi:hypothetical protein
MAKPVRMHVARTPSKYVDKAGNVHRYESVLVRRTYRDGNKVRHETLANLSKLPAETIAVIEATLKGRVMVPAEAACTIIRSLPHGHVAAVAAMARRLGFPALLGPACRSRDLALGLIISRVIRPASKLSTLSRWSDTTLGGDLGAAGASTDEVYAAMDTGKRWCSHSPSWSPGVAARGLRSFLSPEANAADLWSVLGR